MLNKTLDVADPTGADNLKFLTSPILIALTVSPLYILDPKVQLLAHISKSKALTFSKLLPVSVAFRSICMPRSLIFGPLACFCSTSCQRLSSSRGRGSNLEVNVSMDSKRLFTVRIFDADHGPEPQVFK